MGMDGDIYILTDAAILRNIGSAIRRNRIDKQITQEQLANSANVAVSSIRNIEQGKNISLNTLLPILRTLHMLDSLRPLLKTREQSPIQLAAQMGKQKEKQRAVPRNSKHKQNRRSEW